MSEYIERRRKYVNLSTGQISQNYTDVLTGRLKFNMRYVLNKEHSGEPGAYFWQWKHRFSRETLFQDVEIVRQEPILSEGELPPRGSVKPPDLLTSVKQLVAEDWRNGQFHVVMHSGGYDSRLLSALLKQMGIGGDLLFVCTKVEADAFRQIMNFEGWPQKYWCVYNEHVPLDEYFEDSILDFSGAWRCLGGVARLPANLFWYTIAGLQKKGILPADEKIDIWFTQHTAVFTQLGGGDADHLNELWKNWGFHNIRIRPFKCAREFSPWMNLEMIKKVGGLSYDEGPFTESDSPGFRRKLCELARPGLSKIPNPHKFGDEDIRISGRLGEAARSAYRKSWYGRHIAPDVGNRAPTTTGFSDWWEHWTSASLCEHLLSKGFEIGA